MARQRHTPAAAPGGTDYDGATLTMTAANVGNKEDVVWTGKEIIIARNSNAGVTVRNVTITSVADTWNRTKDMTKAIAAGAYAIFGPFPADGWRQADGTIYFEADNAEVLFGVIRIP